MRNTRRKSFDTSEQSGRGVVLLNLVTMVITSGVGSRMELTVFFNVMTWDGKGKYLILNFDLLSEVLVAIETLNT